MSFWQSRGAFLAAATLVLAILVCADPAGAGMIGNALTPRSTASDTVSTVLYTNYVPIPVDGTVDALGLYSQGNAGANSFRMLQLRPTGAANQYTLLYDSGAITPPAAASGKISIPLPGGPVSALAGDLFAHYGYGIPYSPSGVASGGGINTSNSQVIYWSVPSIPAVGINITLGGAGFPVFPQNRDYAWAVNMPILIETEIQPSYASGDYYRVYKYNGTSPPPFVNLLNDEIWNYDTGVWEQYAWYDLSSALSEIPTIGPLVSAKIRLQGQVLGNSSPASAMLGIFAAPDSNYGIDSIYLDDSGQNITKYYAAHPGDVIDAYQLAVPGNVTTPTLITAEWDITPLVAQWLANPNDPLAGKIVLLNSHDLQVRWFPPGLNGLPGPTLTVLNRVPEPSTVALMAVGGLGLAGYGLRRRRKK